MGHTKRELISDYAKQRQRILRAMEGLKFELDNLEVIVEGIVNEAVQTIDD